MLYEHIDHMFRQLLTMMNMGRGHRAATVVEATLICERLYEYARCQRF